MPLINFQTDLTNLPWGKDRRDGGSSNQPYIKSSIPDTFSGLNKTGGPDFLLRGGLLTPGKIVKDVSRLTQMFFDFKSPNGLLFTAKQNILSRTAVKTEASYGIGYGGTTPPNFITGEGGGPVNEGIYTFVAVDRTGSAVRVPQIVPETALEKERFDGALRRKQLSLVLSKKMDPKDATELKALFF